MVRTDDVFRYEGLTVPIESLQKNIGAFMKEHEALIHAVQGFIIALENVLHDDWAYAQAILASNERHLYIAEKGSFLYPQVASPGDNWANRSQLLVRYQRLLGTLAQYGIALPDDIVSRSQCLYQQEKPL